VGTDAEHGPGTEDSAGDRNISQKEKLLGRCHAMITLQESTFTLVA